MMYRYRLVPICFILFIASQGVAWSLQTFRVANYNVENLFDLEKSGREYDEYIPFSYSGWNRNMLDVKCRQLARVIADIKADIVALEEVESNKALLELKRELKKKGCDYPFAVMSDTLNQAVGCALLSKYPLKSKKDLMVDKGRQRSILKAHFDISGRPFIVYVNHWASKKSPESDRVKSAIVLRNEINTHPIEADFLVIGDFNSDYDEYRTFIHEPDLNDTSGRTGINHVIQTFVDGVFVDEKKLRQKEKQSLLYNLWLEVPSLQRWSYIFNGKGSSLDNIMVPMALYDGKGIDYKDNSFKRFAPEYLFSGKTIYRWQMDRTREFRHLGKGFSDHLPVFADFEVYK